ncbi:MAG: low temperature requirement protein A [Nocardioidaceae bacterium]|nr:low temperature requirement protein A [Nocardioidaceae bacterium]
MTDIAPGAPALEEERHASWAELFFDLVAVAGVGMLSHVLSSHLDLATVGLYAVLFLSFWLTWATFMLYGNVAAGRTHLVRLLAGMFGLGVMASAIPGVAHAVLEGGDSHDLQVYAIAYVATRWVGSQSWQRGEVLVDFPVAQHLAGTVPWVVSFWADGQALPWLWGGGILLDLFVMFVVSGDDMVERYQARIDENRRHGRDRRRGRPTQGDGPVFHGVSVDAAHLAERLGLFVIIVLGESVVQVVDAAADPEPDRALFGAGVASFALLAGMFGLSVLHGHAGLPHLAPGRLTTRAQMALHCLVTGDIATIAVVLAVVVERSQEALDDPRRWLLCAAVTAYFLLGLVASVVTRGLRPLATVWWLVTGVAVPIALGAWGADLSGTLLVWILAAVLMLHLWAERAQGPAVVPTEVTEPQDLT